MPRNRNNNSQFWKLFKDKVSMFWTDIGITYFLFWVGLAVQVYITDNNTFLYDNRLITIFIYSIVASLLTFHLKTKEKQKTKTELDTQYKAAFKLSGQSIYNLHTHIQKFSSSVDITPYLTDLLWKMSECVRAILEANYIFNNTITASIMIVRPSVSGSQRQLEIIAFGGERYGREKRKLNLPDRLDKHTPPGAPEAFLTGGLVYIKDTSKNGYYSAQVNKAG